MGVLDPLQRNSEEIQELKNEYSEACGEVIVDLQEYHEHIINDRYDMLEEYAPSFYYMWTEDELEDMETKEDVRKELESLKRFKKDITLAAVEAKYAESFVEKNDVDINYDKPIESYKAIESLQHNLENLDERIHQTMIEKLDIDDEKFSDKYTYEEYKTRKSFFKLSNCINAFYLQEAFWEINENIEREKEELLSEAVIEHRKGRQEYKDENDFDPFPDEPIDWSEKIDKDCLADFFDISELLNGWKGFTLHKMMEEDICPEMDRLEPEYRLDFLNKGEESDTHVLNSEGEKLRIDNTVVPDAVDDLFVYEFKHMPQGQKENLEKNGELKFDKDFLSNVGQLNGYLEDLNLPVGMLVFISSDIDIEEYVVEQHSRHIDDEAVENHIHKKDDYDFSKVLSQI